MNALAYWSAFAIPLALVFVTALARKIVRGTRFRISDFFLGIDLTLAAISVGAINVVDDVSRIDMGNPNAAILGLVFTLACFVLLILQLAVHQRDPREREAGESSIPLRRKLVLLVGANGSAIVLLSVFIVLKIRGNL